jgi:hypothetical protein
MFESQAFLNELKRAASYRYRYNLTDLHWDKRVALEVVLCIILLVLRRIKPATVPRAHYATLHDQANGFAPLVRFGSELCHKMRVGNVLLRFDLLQQLL